MALALAGLGASALAPAAADPGAHGEWRRQSAMPELDPDRCRECRRNPVAEPSAPMRREPRPRSGRRGRGRRWVRAHRGRARVDDERPRSSAWRALHAAVRAPRTSVRPGCGTRAREIRPHRTGADARPGIHASGEAGPPGARRRRPGAAELPARRRPERIGRSSGRLKRGHVPRGGSSRRPYRRPGVLVLGQGAECGSGNSGTRSVYVVHDFSMRTRADHGCGRVRGEGDRQSTRRPHHAATTPSVRGSVAPAYAPGVEPADDLTAPEVETIRRDADPMAAASETLDHVRADLRLNHDPVRHHLPAGRVQRALRIEAVIDHRGDHLEVPLGLHLAPHHAERPHRSAASGEKAGDDGVPRPLAPPPPRCGAPAPG